MRRAVNGGSDPWTVDLVRTAWISWGVSWSFERSAFSIYQNVSSACSLAGVCPL